MKITLAVPSVCPELYSYMHFLGLSLHRFNQVSTYILNYVQFVFHQLLLFLTIKHIVNLIILLA